MLRTVPSRRFRRSGFVLAAIFLAGVLASAPQLWGQQPIDIPTAPMPAQIATAKNIFISNTGIDSDKTDYAVMSDQVYNRFYAAMKDWKRHELVDAPAKADLVLEISFAAPVIGYSVSGGTKHWPASGGTDNDPQFRLTIVDPATHVALWTLIEHVEPALLQSNRDKNLDLALGRLVNDVEALDPAFIAAQTKTEPALAVSVDPQNGVVKSGSQVRVEVTARNVSRQQQISFAYAAGDPLTCIVSVRDADGNPVPDTEQGKKLKDAHATWKGRPVSYLLDPGEAQNRECDVSGLHDMSHPGKYSIQVEMLDQKPVQSNTAVVTVTH
ncbi:MAG TPA: hypothetical protein VK699_16925 [Terriglobales bacterium]|jgi:hypothetical protein|nr:hypothetical protein [Terriglobales bacterium]